MKKYKARIKAQAEVEMWVQISEDEVGNREIEDIIEVGEVSDIDDYEVKSICD